MKRFVYQGVAAAVALSMGLAAPVFASSAGRGGGEIRSRWGAPVSPTEQATIPTRRSKTFAGYSIVGRGEGTWKVAASIVVPKVTCTRGPQRAIDPSVGVHNMRNSFSSAGVVVECSRGNAHYFVSLVLNGRDHNYFKLVARPGDTVVLRVSQRPKATFVSAIDKSRTSVHRTLKGAGSRSGDAPWVGDSAWDHPRGLGVPNFGKLHFSDATLNGKPFGSAGGAAVVRWNRARARAIQISTGALVSRKSFDTIFQHP